MEYMFFIALFFVASQVACNGASPLLPVEISLSKYQVENAQGMYAYFNVYLLIRFY